MVLFDVGMTACNQLLDDGPHLRNMFGGARLDRWPQAAQCIDVGMKLPFGLFCDLADGFVERQVGKITRRTGVDLVVDVGDVADVGDVTVTVDMPQQPEQNVEHDHRAGIADMGEVVDGRTADVHPHIRRIERPQRLLFLRQGVVQAKFHWSSIQKRKAKEVQSRRPGVRS